jgi:hypothetical protein
METHAVLSILHFCRHHDLDGHLRDSVLERSFVVLPANSLAVCSMASKYGQAQSLLAFRLRFSTRHATSIGNGIQADNDVLFVDDNRDGFGIRAIYAYSSFAAGPGNSVE